MTKRKRGFIPFSEYDDSRKVNAWSPDNIGTPDDYAISSHKKFNFSCYTCNHQFSMSLCNITVSGSWCPYCAGKKICGEHDCLQCYEKSFAFHFPEKVIEWSKKNNKTPNQVMKSSHMKFYFDCQECGHEYQTDPNHIGGGRGCKYCANQALCDSLDCVLCLEKTFKFLSPRKSEDWSDKNTQGPDRVFNGSKKKAIFNCKKCNNEYTSIINNASDESGQGCPHCQMFRNKSMSYLCSTLDITDNIQYAPEVVVKCKRRNLFWDMVVTTEHGKIHIESDGHQHFSLKGMIGVARGSTTDALERFTRQRENDLLKEEYIRTNNGLLFRYSYRQRDRIPEFVERMLREIKLGTKGVIYLDTLYENWGPITGQN